MSYLLYCIFVRPEGRLTAPPAGVGGSPVQAVTEQALAAAVSPFAGEGAPVVSEVLAYQRVVEWFHRERTVIPMRYGCVFEEPSQITRMLAERRQEFQALLGEWEGLVEMGIRVLAEGPSPAAPAPESEVRPPPVSRPIHGGTVYLTARRGHYQALDGAARDLDEIAEKIRRLLSGLFVRSRKEPGAPASGPLVSLYFLVPRASVEQFSRKALRLSATVSGKLLLSGPWPPYNFAGLPEHAQESK